jgi:hypothetical protein
MKRGKSGLHDEAGEEASVGCDLRAAEDAGSQRCKREGRTGGREIPAIHCRSATANGVGSRGPAEAMLPPKNTAAVASNAILISNLSLRPANPALLRGRRTAQQAELRLLLFLLCCFEERQKHLLDNVL